MKFQVTREHIRDGRRNSCSSCPVALAIRAQFPDEGTSVHADLEVINIGERSYPTPEKVRRFMNSFDYDAFPRRKRSITFTLPIEELPHVEP